VRNLILVCVAFPFKRSLTVKWKLASLQSQLCINLDELKLLLVLSKLPWLEYRLISYPISNKWGRSNYFIGSGFVTASAVHGYFILTFSAKIPVPKIWQRFNELGPQRHGGLVSRHACSSLWTKDQLGIPTPILNLYSRSTWDSTLKCGFWRLNSCACDCFLKATALPLNNVASEL